MRRAFQDAVWIVGLCALAGCSGGNGDSPPPPLQSSSKITIAPAGPLNLAAGGEGVQLSATLTLPSGAVDKTAVFTWKSGDNAIVSVTSQGFVTGLKVGVASVTAVSGTTAGGITIGVVGTAMGAKTLTLSGNADYEDRTFGPNGFTGALNATPIRQAVVEAVAIDGFQVIGATTSDANGDFALTVDNSTRRGGVYLRVVSKTDTAQKTKIHIKDNAVDQNFLSFASKSMDDSLSDPFSATQNILATAASKIGGAFNILAVLVDASEFVQAVGSCPSSPYPDCVPPLVTVYWEPGSAEGTFYDTTADA
ncbi:MAG: Ig-like domain-containing protein, partial [Nitrospiria bacterium]